MNNKTDKSANYLEFIPIPARGLVYKVTDGQVTLFQDNKGFFNFVAQKLFKRPAVSQIHLDEIGNFIWPLMDGERDIYAIAQCMEEAFGEKVHPLYDRAVRYFKTLDSYGFIQFVNR